MVSALDRFLVCPISPNKKGPLLKGPFYFLARLSAAPTAKKTGFEREPQHVLTLGDPIRALNVSAE